ncbi:MAG: ThuA domain-containing protein [bacterium]
MNTYAFIFCFVFTASITSIPIPAFAANDLPKELDISDEQAKAIISHMPAQAAAVPEKPRRLLVYIQTDQFRTPGEPYVNRALKVMAEKTDAFSVDYSTDINVFLPGTLNQYDAFLLNSTVNMPVSPETTPEICKSIMDFVKGGKGAIGIHGAVDNFRNWPEAQEMFGNLFRGHPWDERGAWAVKIDEPDHPLTAPFKGHRGFRIVTELYASTPPIYSRGKQRILMSLDMSDPATRARATEDRDLDTGISWIKNWGQGRVFYTNLGHGGNGAGLELENTPVLEHLLLGIQWALGDLKNVDAAPKDAPKKK